MQREHKSVRMAHLSQLKEDGNAGSFSLNLHLGCLKGCRCVSIMDSEECADTVTLAENSKSLCTQVIIKGDVDGIYTSRPEGVALTLARRSFMVS